MSSKDVLNYCSVFSFKTFWLFSFKFSTIRILNCIVAFSVGMHMQSTLNRLYCTIMTTFRNYRVVRQAENNLWHNIKNTGMLRQMQCTPAENVRPGFPVKVGLNSQQLTGTRILTSVDLLNWKVIRSINILLIYLYQHMDIIKLLYNKQLTMISNIFFLPQNSTGQIIMKIDLCDHKQK